MRELYKGQKPYIFEKDAEGNIPQYGRGFPNHAGFAPAVDTGYDVAAAKINSENREEALAAANGCLRDNEWYVKFFVNDITIEFALSGTTAQSKYTRDFYAHNIIMPAWRVSAQVLDQRDYGTLVEFVHQAQQKSVASSLLLQLEIGHGGLNVAEKFQSATQEEETEGVKMKGTHNHILCQGYIQDIQRVYRKGEYYPSFQFAFVAAVLYEGIKDIVSEEPAQRDWIQIIEGIKASEPELTEATAQNVNATPRVGVSSPEVLKRAEEEGKALPGSINRQLEEQVL